MIINYLKIAIRNLIGNKLFSIINIAGLSIGIAGSLLILVYVSDQLSYESIHKNADNIVRVSAGFGSGDGAMKLAGAMPGIGPAAAEEIPEVKAAVRFRKNENAKIKVGNKEIIEDNFFFADSNVFNVFTFPFLYGDKDKALLTPNSIVISEEIAEKYFGKDNAIGENLILNDKYNFTVSGVMENVPANTSLRCDFIAPYSKAVEVDSISAPWNSWGEDYTFILTNNNASLPILQTKLHGVLQKHTNENFAKLISLYVLPLRDIYFKSDMLGELGPTGNISTVYIFSSIAILVLLIACFNFVNLSTARSFRRSKEVGVRKVLGANRLSLFKQFWGESILLTIIAVIISLILYELFNPVLFKYFDLNVEGLNYLNLNFFPILGGIILFVSLFAGIYPAVFLSRFQPVDSLKGVKTPGSSGSGLRKLLVVLQFAISIFLLIGSATIYKQLQFMLHSDPGFNRNNVFIISYPISKEGMVDKYTVLKNEFLSIPGVLDVSGAYSIPGINNTEKQTFKIKGQENNDKAILQASGVDYNFIQTLGLKVVQGRNFSQNFGTDADNSIIINESAVKKLGLQNPVGTEVYIPSGKTDHLVKIIGVIKDFHLTSFHNAIEPLFLYINPERYFNLAVKYDPKNAKQVLSGLKEKYSQIVPDKEFRCKTLGEQYGTMYQTDEKNGTLILIFTVLSVIIAALGLFGLSSFAIEVRLKEIGIRKVLGADIKNILILLSKDFTKWVLIANIIAFPAAYYAILKWLDDFAYKTNMSVWIYILSALAALFISLITITFQSIKAANTDPVKTLRYE